MPALVNKLAQERIKNAFEKFEGSVSREDAQLFHSVELRDVRRAALDIQAQLKQRGSFHNIRRLEPLLKAFDKYSGALDVLANGTPFLPWIWAPIKLMLQIATDHVSSLDTLLDAYRKIGEALPRLDRYAHTFPSFEMQDVLSLLYEDIIEFHRRAYKYFRRRAWKVLFDCTWVSFEQRFETILSRLRHHQELVDKEAASFDIVQAKESRQKMDVELDKAERERSDAHRLQVYAWLAVDALQQEDDWYSIRSKRYPGTADWIFQHKKYEEWLTMSEKHPILWVWGKPGSGKSTLCAYVTQRLKEDPKFTTLFYFCHYDRQPEGSVCSHLLRSLASQLVRGDPDLAPLVWNDYVRLGHLASIDHLKTLLPQLVAASNPVRIVLDGLDEADDKEQKVIIDRLQHVVSSKKDHCCLAVFSRNVGTIASKLRGCVTVSLQDESRVIEVDISEFVRGRLAQVLDESNSEISDTAKDKATHHLMSRANGMFLWVELVTSNLRFAMDDTDFLDIINHLPKDLNEAYERILVGITTIDNESVREKTTCVLEWLVYACRPLKVQELLNALGCSSASSSVPTVASARIFDFCKPLIEISGNNVVNLVHFTAKEYLLKPLSKFHMKAHTAQTNLSGACLAYIRSASVFLSRAHRETRLLELLKGQRAFHSYALANWFHHTTEVLPLGHTYASSDLVRSLGIIEELSRPQYKTVTIGSAPVSSALRPQRECLSTLLDSIRAFRTKVQSSKADEHEGKSITDYRLEADPTFLSAIDQQYEIDMFDLLSETSTLPASITQDMVTEFRRTMGVDLWNCRYSNCSQTTTGFSSLKERDLHEQTHAPKLHCDVPSCAFSGRGFGRPRDLQQHRKRYHWTLFEFSFPTISDDADDATVQIQSGSSKGLVTNNAEPHGSSLMSARHGLSTHSTTAPEPNRLRQYQLDLMARDQLDKATKLRKLTRDQEESSSVSMPVYWSHSNLQKFEQLVDIYGTDFEAIADRLESKSKAMVSAHFMMQIANGHVDLQERAKLADQKRARGEREEQLSLPPVHDLLRFNESNHDRQQEKFTTGPSDPFARPDPTIIDLDNWEPQLTQQQFDSLVDEAMRSKSEASTLAVDRPITSEVFQGVRASMPRLRDLSNNQIREILLEQRKKVSEEQRSVMKNNTRLDQPQPSQSPQATPRRSGRAYN